MFANHCGLDVILFMCSDNASFVTGTNHVIDGGERTRLVDLVRRVSRFSGVKLLAYGVMSNHFHFFVYIGPRRGLRTRRSSAGLPRFIPMSASIR